MCVLGMPCLGLLRVCIEFLGRWWMRTVCGGAGSMVIVYGYLGKGSCVHFCILEFTLYAISPLSHSLAIHEHSNLTTTTCDSYQRTPFKMPILRNLTTKIKTAISPSSSPSSSPTSSPSGFEVLQGRRETDGYTVTRPETNARVDSFMTEETSQAKQRRVSKFREELDFACEE
jgi:hypothetical protein